MVSGPAAREPDPKKSTTPHYRASNPQPEGGALDLRCLLRDAGSVTTAPHLRQFRGDLYSTPEFLRDRVDRARAALEKAPRGSYISHHTAAELRGLWVPSSSPVHVSMLPNAGRWLRDGVQPHRGHTDAWVADVAGIRVSRPEQIVVELARNLDLVSLTALIDSVLHRGYCDVTGLAAYARQRRFRSRTLDQALALAQAGAGSAMESRTRVLLVTAGLPQPGVQVRVRVALAEFSVEDRRLIEEFSPLPPALHAARREVTFSLDIAYEHLKLAAEFDGEHHQLPEQRAYDEVRRGALRDRGWRINVATHETLTSPAEFLREFVASYNELSPVSVTCSEDWRKYFVDRHRVSFSRT